MKTTTLADITLSAQAAANKAFTAKDALERQSIKLSEFNAAGFDRADFATWENGFNGQIEMLAHFSREDSPATKAAKVSAKPSPASTTTPSPKASAAK